MYEDKPDWSLTSFFGSASKAGSIKQNSELSESIAIWLTAMLFGLIFAPFSLLFFVIKHEFEVGPKTWTYFAIAWMGMLILLVSIASA